MKGVLGAVREHEIQHIVRVLGHPGEQRNAPGTFRTKGLHALEPLCVLLQLLPEGRAQYAEPAVKVDVMRRHQAEVPVARGPQPARRQVSRGGLIQDVDHCQEDGVRVGGKVLPVGVDNRPQHEIDPNS